MSREDQHFRMRIPEAVKIWVKDQADMNRRSMTAQIVYLLETSMKAEKEKGEAA